MKLRRLPALAMLVAALASPALASAQALPPVCTSSTPTELGTPALDAPLSVVWAENSAWVLYSDRDTRGQGRVRLLQLAGLLENTVSVTTFDLDPGSTMAHGLAVSGRGLYAAYVRPDGSLGLYHRALVGGAEERSTVATGRPASLSLTAVRAGLLLGWTEPSGTLHWAAVDEHAQAQATHTLALNLGSPLALGVGAGAFFAANLAAGPAVLGTVLARDGARFSPSAALRASSGATAWDAAVLGGRTFAVAAAGGLVRSASWAGAAGAGEARILPGGSAASLVTVGAAPWGALAAWSGVGGLQAALLNANNSRASGPYVLVDRDVGASSLAVLNTGHSALVFYSASRPSPSLRMVRLECVR